MKTFPPLTALVILGLGCLMLGGCSLFGDPEPEAPADATPPPRAAAPAPVPSAPAAAPLIAQRPIGPARIDPPDFAPSTPVRMAFIWYDHPALQTRDFMETRVQLTPAQGFTRLRFPLPALGIDCSGMMRFAEPDAQGLVGGEFQISCSDNALASGLIVPVAGQAAINGQGADQFGRSVIFAIQMDG